MVIALPSASHEAIMRIVNHCRRDGVQFRLVPDLYEVSLGRLDIDTVNGIPLMGMKDHAILGVNFLTKRVIDVAVALTMLVAVLVVLRAAGAADLVRGPRRLAAVRPDPRRARRTTVHDAQVPLDATRRRSAS